MIGWILSRAGRDPTVMNGAVMKNFASARRARSPAPWSAAATPMSARWTKATARSRSIRPRIAVLNNVSLDHKSLDELNALFADFTRQGGDGGRSTPTIPTPPRWRCDCPPTGSCGFRSRATAISSRRGIVEERPFCGRRSTLDGRSASELARAGPPQCRERARGARRRAAAGVPLADAIRAIAGFTGLKRRFELVGEAERRRGDRRFRAQPRQDRGDADTLHAFPGRLLLLFQPHGFGPLKVMRRELVAMFAAQLNADDRLVADRPGLSGRHDQPRGHQRRHRRRPGRARARLPRISPTAPPPPTIWSRRPAPATASS